MRKEFEINSQKLRGIRDKKEKYKKTERWRGVHRTNDWSDVSSSALTVHFWRMII